MTATDAAPDPLATEARWQQLLDRIHDLEARVAATSTTITAALDVHLARLDALRHHLAQPAWTLPAPGSEQRAPGCTVPHRGAPPAQVGKASLLGRAAPVGGSAQAGS
ncbi:hypothetical protein ACFC1T_18170 [Kitasatospora sp. NPDC056076]|uniref:hypothetical protein n=1 Tax=Kitasatospora sp. NPDC056076 TaxID=3345703 RepID=UPI0035E1D055